MDTEVDSNHPGNGWTVLIATIGYSAVAFGAAALLWDSRNAVSAFLSNPKAVLATTVTADSALMPALFGFLAAVAVVISLWSVASLVVTELVLALSAGRRLTIRSVRLLVRASSPLVRPLVRKRLATAALSVTLLAGGVPAFAANPDTIPDDLGWVSKTQVSKVVEGVAATNAPDSTEHRSTEAAATTSGTNTTDTAASQADQSEPRPSSPTSAPKPSAVSSAQTESSAPTNPVTSHPDTEVPAPKSGASAPSRPKASPAPTSNSQIPADLSLKAAPSKNETSPKADELTGEIESILAQAIEIAKEASESSTYVVREGDSLWSIAARHTHSTDPAVITDAWNQIYQLNKESIGDSPDVIYPGMTLNLPKEAH